MIKYFCDGCKKEIIEDIIYRIKIYDVPKDNFYLVRTNEIACFADINDGYVNINSSPMYCKKCKEKVESLIRYSL